MGEGGCCCSCWTLILLQTTYHITWCCTAAMTVERIEVLSSTMNIWNWILGKKKNDWFQGRERRTREQEMWETNKFKLLPHTDIVWLSGIVFLFISCWNEIFLIHFFSCSCINLQSFSYFSSNVNTRTKWSRYFVFRPGSGSIALSSTRRGV